MTLTYDIITFDCYGTLIDWNRGLEDALTTAANAAGMALDPVQARALYQAIEPAVQAAGFRPYREVLAETAQQVAARLGGTLDHAAAQRFAASLPDWPPFPDTDAALSALAAAGYTLGILSNVDDDLLQGTLRHLRTPVELIVTAQQVHSYKPAHGHFLAARARIGGRRWLHAAQSRFHDITPCHQLGIPAVWINRQNEVRSAADPAPLADLPSLTALIKWLGTAERA